jgi:hypothetical protein
MKKSVNQGKKKSIIDLPPKVKAELAKMAIDYDSNFKQFAQKLLIMLSDNRKVIEELLKHQKDE